MGAVILHEARISTQLANPGSPTVQLHVCTSMSRPTTHVSAVLTSL